MDERTLDTLELKALIELAARHVQTKPGRHKLLNLRPMTSRPEILRELEIANECAGYLTAGGKFGLGGIEDPEPILTRLHIEGARLEPRQILALERLLFVSKELRELFRIAETGAIYPHLTRIANRIPDLRRLYAEIHGKILPSGEVDDNASPQLRALRRDLTERRNRIHRTLESLLRGQPQAVQEEIITFRNGRFVIPVRTDSRNQVPGVVHGLSSSGQTTFVEPLTIINQNNDLVRLREQEEIEVFRILLSISDSLRENIDALRTIVEIIAELDAAQAKAGFAAEFQCTPPKIAKDNHLTLIDARHILLERSLGASGGKAVPISLDLGENGHVCVVSGPNAGGKTVVLKTVGLISLMAQMGFHVPAREAILPIFEQVFADIGDQQSIADSLSTFTAHMRNIAAMVEAVRPQSLILLDEVGTGTDPDEGAALAIAIVDYFRRSGAMTIATTHYPRLKMWASQTAEVKNASVEFDERTLLPTYRLILGAAGASSGLEIAKRMYVSEEILHAAAALVEPSHIQATEYLKRLKQIMDEQDHLRAALEDERIAVAEKYSRLEGDFAKKEDARRLEFDAALARVISDFTVESDRAARKIKDRTEAARIKKAAEIQTSQLRHISAKLQQSAGFSGAERDASIHKDESIRGTEVIREGDRVSIRPLDRTGIVEAIHGDTYVIIVGSLRYRSNRDDLIKMAGEAPSFHQVKSASIDETLDQPTASELKIIGLAADEARDRVDKFLDQAFLSGIESVRIIHGHGKGILRNAVAELLAHHPQVERFKLAPREQGGSGATIVEIRK